MYDPPSLPPAGWYPDPEHPGGRRRWWNGRSWDAAWAPAGFEAGGLPDIGEWLSRSFARMWRHWRALAIISAVTGVPSGVLTAIALRRAFDGVTIVDDEVIGWSNERLPVAIALVVVATALATIGGIAATWLMLRTTDADDSAEPVTAVEVASITTTSELEAATTAFGASLRALPRIIGWMVVVTLVVLVAVAVLVVVTVIALPLGILLMLACIPGALYLMVRFAFIFTALVDRPGNPFTRSASVSRGRFWATFGRLALIMVIIYGISIPVNMITSIASGAGFGGAFGSTGDFRIDSNGIEAIDLSAVAPSTLAIVIGAIATLVSGVVVSGLAGASSAELYRTRNPVA